MFKIDNEFKGLIPPPSSDELKMLEENLVENGCITPLIVWKEEGLLIDGHNRYEICTRLSIPYKTQEISLASRTETAVWILKNQMGRRNLSDNQRAMLGGKLANLKPGSNQFNKKEVPSNEGTSITEAKAAAIMNVSEQSVQRAKKVLRKGSEDLIKSVENGEIPVSRAAGVADLPKEEQMQAATAPRKPTVRNKESKERKEVKNDKGLGLEERPWESTEEALKNASTAASMLEEAIRYMNRILETDPKRILAFDYMAKWVKDNRDKKILNNVPFLIVL